MDGAGQLGGHGLGHVRVHGGRGLFADGGRDRVPAGLGVPADRPRRHALDVGRVRRATDRTGCGRVRGAPPTADRHGTGVGGPGGRRLRPPGARVPRARRVRAVRGRACGRGDPETFQDVVVDPGRRSHHPIAVPRRPGRGRRGRRRAGRLPRGRGAAVGRRSRRVPAVLRGRRPPNDIVVNNHFFFLRCNISSTPSYTRHPSPPRRAVTAVIFSVFSSLLNRTGFL